MELSIGCGSEAVPLDVYGLDSITQTKFAIWHHLRMIGEISCRFDYESCHS